MTRLYSIRLCDNERDLIVASWDNLSDADVMGVLCNINPGPGISIEVKISEVLLPITSETSYRDIIGHYPSGVAGVVKSVVHIDELAGDYSDELTE